jgi:NAD(P)-dependent dehydrogenase (short-subunit alcohol dehydrogenase family)
MTSRVVVVTGASSGIGLETAKAFAALGWHVIGTGRNPDRSAAAEAEVRSSLAKGGKLDFLRVDMALMSETKRIADEIKALTPCIDVLINNAGGVRDQRYVTSEGTEETFTANHLAPFLLTRELLPLLRATASQAKPGDVRILAISSRAYMNAPSMNWDDLQNLSGEFQAAGAYCQAKLANSLFSHELAKRVSADGIAAHALIPGAVHTNFASHGDATMQSYMKAAQGLTPQEVAKTLVLMATAEETGLPGGRHFYELSQLDIMPHGNDDAAAARLWAESEALLSRLGY